MLKVVGGVHGAHLKISILLVAPNEYNIIIKFKGAAVGLYAIKV